MTSKVFVVYIMIAIVVTSLTANPIIPSESAANITLAVSPANTGAHANGPSTAAGNASLSAPSSQTASTSNNASTINDHASATDATSVAHSPTLASNQSSATPQTMVAAYDPQSESSAHANGARTTNSTAASQAHATSSNTPSGSHQEDAHVKSIPVAKSEADGQLALPLIPTCYNKKKSYGIEMHHCEKALDKVVYEANQTLDRFSSFIFANYKTCNVNVYKPKNANLTKAQVGSMVHNIADSCHSVGGMLFKTSKIAVQIERSKPENTYEVDTPLCQKEQCPLTLGDCLSAFYQIPLDRKGRLTSKNSTNFIARVASGNCSVMISTTDYSDIDISRQNVYPTMRKLFNQCGRHPGKIYLPGGSTGFNGDLKISTHASNQELCEQM